MTWTKEDEKLLKELQERKQQETRVLEDCVRRAVNQFHLYHSATDELADALIKNATQIRKVLEPFDEEAQQ